MTHLITALLLDLPLVIAGLVLVFCLKSKLCSWMSHPIDGGQFLWGKRIFGDHKTWLGLSIMVGITAIFGVLLWMNIPLLQRAIEPSSAWLVTAGFLLVGLSYTLGELINSFIKRRLNISPGTLPKTSARNLFKVFDLMDGILVAALTYWLVFSVELIILFYAVVFGAFIHWCIHVLMIKLHLKAE